MKSFLGDGGNPCRTRVTSPKDNNRFVEEEEEEEEEGKEEEEEEEGKKEYRREEEKNKSWRNLTRFLTFLFPFFLLYLCCRRPAPPRERCGPAVTPTRPARPPWSTWRRSTSRPHEDGTPGRVPDCVGPTEISEGGGACCTA